MNKMIKQFLIFLGLVFLYALYSSIVIMALKDFGLNLYSLSDKIQNIALILIDISFMFIIYFIYRKELKKEFTAFIKNFKDNFFFGLKWWLIGLMLMVSSNIIINLIYSSPALNEQSVQTMLKQMPIYVAFSACIFAPFCEEIIFRKSLGKVFKNSFIFILVSGLLFGLVHNLDGLGTLQMLYLIPYGLFGCIFAFMYKKKKNIFVSMTFHFIHNFLLVSLSILFMGVM